MIHNRRTFCVNPAIASEEAIGWLLKPSCTLCSGFQFGERTLWLNDAFSEDGAQEYAVYRIVEDHRDAGGNGFVVATQIESITASWTTPDRLRRSVEESQTDKWPPLSGNREFIRLEGGNHKCGLCE